MTPKTIQLSTKQPVHPLCKILIALGIALITLLIIDTYTNLLKLTSTTQGTILAFIILSLGVGIILYFFSCLFRKLAKIAEEIEHEEPPNDLNQDA